MDHRSSPSSEDAIRMQLLPSIPQHISKLGELITSHNADTRFRLYVFLLQAIITPQKVKKDYSWWDASVQIKGKNVAEMQFDRENVFRPSMTVFLLSLGQSEEEKEKYRSAKSARDIQYCLSKRGLVLLQKNDRSFIRIGTFDHAPVRPWTSDPIEVKWLFEGVQSTWVTFV